MMDVGTTPRGSAVAFAVFSLSLGVLLAGRVYSGGGDTLAAELLPSALMRNGSPDYRGLVVPDHQDHYGFLLVNERVLAFLAGAAPAAAGAIIGAAVPLTLALSETWQYAILGASVISLLLLRRAIVPTLILAGCAGVAASLLGAPIA